MATEQPSAEVNRLSILLQLEGMARGAQSIKELQFLFVNELRKLVPYRQAFLLSADSAHKNLFKLETASSIAMVDRNTSFSQWLESSLAKLGRETNLDVPQCLDVESLPQNAKQEWKEHSLPFVLWCPLILIGGRVLGGVWLSRETPWKDSEVTLVKRLADTFAHAWLTLLGQEKLKPSKHYERVILGSVIFIIFSFFIIPVRISALAPVEVVAKSPAIVSAPMDGVISEVLLLPNAVVNAGDTILTYEDTGLRSRYEVAEKTLSVAIAEYQKAAQEAFQNARSNAQVALLKSQVELRQAERDYAKELLQQVEVKAPRSGILIYSDKSDWIGKPVQVGQRIMQVAEPSMIELRISLPVHDAIFLVEGSEAKIFLDVDPLNSIPSVITHASYEAEVTPEGTLAYKIDAAFKDQEEQHRIGLQGTAKIYGERVSLFFYLFRRPLATLRQIIGI